MKEGETIKSVIEPKNIIRGGIFGKKTKLSRRWYFKV